MVKADMEFKDTEVKDFTFTIKESDGSIFDLTGYSTTIQVKRYGETTLSVDTGCALTATPTDGKCTWSYSADLIAGDFAAEIEVSNGSGTLLKTKTFSIEVESDLT